MQFRVPQNIDLEDKIVGPLTLVQFLYVLSGGLADYILYGSLGQTNFPVFVILALPVTVLALALAFLKIQEQPLAHFISAGLIFLSRPKLRFWQRQEPPEPILVVPKGQKTEEAPIIKKQIDKSELDQLAFILDTQMPEYDEAKRLGSIARSFEKILKEDKKT